MTLEEAVREIGRLHEELREVRSKCKWMENRIELARRHLGTAAGIIEEQRKKMVRQREENDEMSKLLQTYRDTRSAWQKRYEEHYKLTPDDGPSGRGRHD